MNNILNTSFDTLYLFAGMVLVEYIVALVMTARKNLSLLRVFFAVLTGNALSAIMCLFLPAENTDFGYYTWLGIALSASVVLEHFVYVGYFRDEVYTFRNIRFFFCSLLANIVSFAGVALLHHFEVID